MALCLDHVSASMKLFSNVYNYMANVNPTLIPTMIREYEQDLWEPEPVDKYLQLAKVVPSPQGPHRLALTNYRSRERKA